MTTALTWLGVGVLGGLGALLRFRVGQIVAARWPTAFPLGTLAVNLSGAFALGVLAGAEVPDQVLLVVGGGLLGGYTTFSTWMVESERLFAAARPWLALANLLGSTAAGLSLVGLGLVAGGALA